MATAGSTQQLQRGGSAAAAANQPELDPRYELQENATGFIVRVPLPGFRREDLKLHVDSAGRLTVRGQRSDAAANATHSRFYKIFDQLPSISKNDDLAARFADGVLTVTVTKRQPASSSQQQEQDAKEPPAGEANRPKDDANPKPQDAAAATKKPDAQQQLADAGKPEPEQPKAPPAARKEEGMPRAAGAAAAAAPAPAAADMKPSPPQADAERKAVDPPETETETEAEEDTETERQRQQGACRSLSFKERVAEELQALAGSEWAEGLVQTVKNHREVIAAAAVAAFSIGIFISIELFSSSTNGGTGTN